MVQIVKPTPQPGPQEAFARCAADECLYGGAAGGGKTWALINESVRYQDVLGYHAIILRRTTPELRQPGGVIDQSRDMFGAWAEFSETKLRWTFPSGATLSFGHMEKEGDRHKYQSAQFAYIGFDQVESFTALQYEYMFSRLRTTVGVPTYMRACANPPDEEQPGAEWVLPRFAPWLDDMAPNPAESGEVRFFKRIDGKDIEVLPGTDKATTRTFIRATIYDNQILLAQDPEYLVKLEGLPEPYRSMLLDGVWMAGLVDERRVIPIAWIKEAQARWTASGGLDSDLTGVGVDVGRGGNKTVQALRRGSWIDELKSDDTPDTMKIPNKLKEEVDPRSVAIIDVIGVGAGVVDRLKEMKHEEPDKVCSVVPFNGSNKSTRVDRTGHFGFANMRAEAHWNAREMLDPQYGYEIALPPDPELLADLASAKWVMRATGVAVEKKDLIAKRLGRSPDKGDAVMMVLWLGSDPPAAAVGDTMQMATDFEDVWYADKTVEGELEEEFALVDEDRRLAIEERMRRRAQARRGWIH